VAERLAGLADQVQWLTATRQLPERVLPYPTAPRWRMRPDGGDAASVLAGSPELLAEVSSWYERNLRRRLHVQDVPPDRFRLMLQHVDKVNLDTDLADNGEGTIQVLPVLTALALIRRQDQGGPGILAIEEPESHLHPSLQAALAQHLCEIAAASPEFRIVLETHSEHLLLGVQLQIVRGLLRPEDVRVYWVRQLDGGQSVAEPASFDENARPQGAWPPGIFSEDTDGMRPDQRHHYNMKHGFQGDRKNGIPSFYEAFADHSDLQDGFGQDIASLFHQEQLLIREEWLAKDGQQEETLAMVQSILQRL
jgi:hypothetical protein